MSTTLQTAPSKDATAETIECPHCHKQFGPTVDPQQPPRLQGSKCPHCRLFVPIERVPERS